MPHFALRAVLFASFVLAVAGGFAGAQALPARSALLELRPSAFAGVTALETGLDNGRNLSLTGGVDVGFLSGHVLMPALEYRGTFALNKGDISSQKDNLGGLKVAAHVWRLRPYVDGLFGRMEINYGAGIEVPGKPIYYTFSSSNVVAFGGGADIDTGRYVSFKADLQVERYKTPVVPAGPLYATAATVGVTYRFDLGRRF